MKKILYIDLDDVVVDLTSHVKKRHGCALSSTISKVTSTDELLFEDPEPATGAVESIKKLMKVYDVYFLTTAPWDNINAWSAKRKWVERTFGHLAYKRLIITHRKDLCIGDYLVDDRPNNGAAGFKGCWIHFGQGSFKGWDEVFVYLMDEIYKTK